MPSNQTSPSSHDEWSEHIAMWRASKLTRIEYCEQRDIKLSSFIYQNNRRQQVQAKSLTLVPVTVRATPRPANGNLVLSGPNGWSLAMASDVSTAWLGELLGRLS
jgi:hypothetical protein